MLNKIFYFFCNFFKYPGLFVDTFFFSQLYENNEETLLSKKIPFGRRIVIYGFGPYGEELFIKFFFSNIIVGIYDANFLEMEKYILSPDEINSDKVDNVIITVMNPDARVSIREFLIEKNFPSEKIVFLKYKY